MQEWTRSGTPVPAIGEDQVLLGTPVIGWGPLVITPQAPPEDPEESTAVGEGEIAAQPQENGNPEDDEPFVSPEARTTPEEDSPRE